ncbi:MAG: class I SAM-dependent methyltransferase [Betaproteobacteria bacterium]|nr:class I SAM-dependent methyltransferase [Betaproteobacteria bacterium]
MSDRTHCPAASKPGKVTRCVVCGSDELHYVEELSAALVGEWELSGRRSGLREPAAGTAVRQLRQHVALHGAGCRAASALWRHRHLRGVFGIACRATAARTGDQRLAAWHGFWPGPGHVFAKFPEVDMQRLPHADDAFDLVVHSDTLEHVPDPLQGLAECRRVLRVGGACVFAVPIIVGRLTRSRAGLAPSYHGNPEGGGGYLVHTEFGADAWTWPFAAGFSECRIVGLEHPAAHALIAVR